MARDIAFEKKVNDALMSAVIYVDTSYGGDGFNESGLHRIILDSYYTFYDGNGGRLVPPIYSDKGASRVRALAIEKRGLEYKGELTEAENKRFTEVSEGLAQGTRAWLDGTWSSSVDSLARAADSVENPRRKRYLRNMEKALNMHLQIRRAEFGMNRMPPYEAIVNACVGCEPEELDIRHVQEDLHDALRKEGYDHGELHKSMDAWSAKHRILSGEEIKDAITRSLVPLEENVRKFLLPKLPKQLRKVSLNRIEITGLPKAFFAASNNYLGHYRSGYEYNMNIKKSEPEIFDMTMHEFLSGHHLQSVINEAMWEKGMAGAEAGVGTMGTPQTALAEGMAVASPYVLEACGMEFDPTQKIAMLRDQLDAAGRLNGSIMRFKQNEPPERVKTYVREQCCFSDEWSKRYVEGWLGDLFLGKVYAPAYGLGNRVVMEALGKMDIDGLVPLLYGVRGPMDLITFKDAVSEARRK